MKDFLRQLLIAVLGRVIGNMVADLIRRTLNDLKSWLDWL